VLGTSRARQVSCLECHNVPGGIYDPRTCRYALAGGSPV
jgi:hypothetical protein